MSAGEWKSLKISSWLFNTTNNISKMNVQNTELYTHTSKVIIKIFMNQFDTLHKTEMQIQRTPLTRNVLNHVGKGKNIRKPIFFQKTTCLNM